ncbi:Similar to Alcohol dehydrogenase 1; acc. no. P41747 [Pyronema omphalodes CBS 100304]|uniref:alcohol dehydrogenase n=1 Tax=Pyronema omphalodes (strain CBS 100304) TaxID=1076935 RepID=U4L3H9_PYROM|nr:Similar to Alcohol dehydrogenase 1; acc. no. P41747 [Pyronema omphalodes CBS 100304]
MAQQEFKIPEKQWAQVFDKHNGPIELKQIPVPKPGPDQILINIKYTGVCHTDLHAWKGDWPLDVKLPLVGGHEGAGVVVAVGELVKDIKVGDHAGIKWLNSSCGQCDFCMAVDEPLCQKAVLSGYTQDGTFQQYALANAGHAARIPKELPLDAMAPILCGGITVYKALKESHARPGDSVVITGAGGGLGTLALQYAKAMGFRTIAVDAGDEKAQLCTEKLGAEVFVDFTKDDVIAKIKEHTGGLGAHAVILLAVSEKPFQQATEYCRSRGSVVCVGLPPGAKISASVFNTVVRMLTIKGSYVGNRLDTQEAIDFFARGLISAPYKVAKLSDLPKVFEMMEKGEIAGRYVLDTTV